MKGILRGNYRGEGGGVNKQIVRIQMCLSVNAMSDFGGANRTKQFANVNVNFFLFLREIIMSFREENRGGGGNESYRRFKIRRSKIKYETLSDSTKKKLEGRTNIRTGASLENPRIECFVLATGML